MSIFDNVMKCNREVWMVKVKDYDIKEREYDIKEREYSENIIK